MSSVAPAVNGDAAPWRPTMMPMAAPQSIMMDRSVGPPGMPGPATVTHQQSDHVVAELRKVFGDASNAEKSEDYETAIRLYRYGQGLALDSLNSQHVSPTSKQAMKSLLHTVAPKERLKTLGASIRSLNQAAVLSQEGAWVQEKYCGPLSCLMCCHPVGCLALYLCGPLDCINVKVLPDGRRLNTHGKIVHTFAYEGLSVSSTICRCAWFDARERCVHHIAAA
jgi:hypothetical protein